jgi:hypothetical protein
MTRPINRFSSFARPLGDNINASCAFTIPFQYIHPTRFSLTVRQRDPNAFNSAFVPANAFLSFSF